jgi:hypothetical protein
MSGDYLPNDLKGLWKELSTNPVPTSPEQLRKETKKFEAGLHRRAIIGGGAALFVMVGFTIYFFLFRNTLQRIGSILTVVSAGYLVIQLRLRPGRAMPDLGEIDCARFYRTELERQRDFHQGTWLWSRVLIFLPGPLLFCMGFARAHPDAATYIWLEFAAIVVLAGIAVPLNLRLARKYQSRIDSLDRSQKELRL